MREGERRSVRKGKGFKKGVGEKSEGERWREEERRRRRDREIE